MPRTLSPLTIAAAALVLVGGMSITAKASELTIVVSGAPDNTGRIGCALYAGKDSFPMDPSKAQVVSHQPEANGAICRFDGLAPGTYAVAVSHDVNGNGETDTNFLGTPKEAWGVSNNVRPTLRAPRFEEAAFDVADAPLQLKIEIAK